MFPGVRSLKAILIAVLLSWAALPAAYGFQLGARSAEEWVKTLESPERLAGLKIDEVLSRLQLKPGMIVADIGAGTGVFSRAFARAVAPGGKVYAVDVDKGLTDYITRRAKQENLANIQAVLGEFDDPKLPARNVDMAFFHDVMHHIEHRQAYLQTLISYLKPAARIVLIEIDPANPHHPHQAHVEKEHGMQLSKASVTHWLAALGFHPAQEFDLFPGEKWFVIYQRGAAPAEHHSGM